MVGLSKKRVFPKTKGDSITGQDRAQKHCDFRFSQIEKKKSKVAVLQLSSCIDQSDDTIHLLRYLHNRREQKNKDGRARITRLKSDFTEKTK